MATSILTTTAALLLVLGVTLPAIAGSITLDVGGAPVTISTTSAQDVRLAELLVVVNQTQEPPHASVNAWLRAVLLSSIQSYVRDARLREAQNACTAYQALTGAQQNQIKTVLGGKEPCAP